MRISERLRPSNEQLAAQKGSKRLEMLIEACLRHVKFKAVLVINLTGYVQEPALTVFGQNLQWDEKFSFQVLLLRIVHRIVHAC